MTTTEELREMQCLLKAYESEINIRLVYLHNEERWANELAREMQKLKWQQEKVDRLMAYRQSGEEQLIAIYDRMATCKKKLIELRNKAAIEKLLKLQAQLDELSEGELPIEALKESEDSDAA